MFDAYWGLERVPSQFEPCALTIGNFDGLHRGHQQILQTTLDLARQERWRAAALTFDPHPTRVVAPERAPALLSTPSERLRRFDDFGMDVGIVLRFNRQMARLSPEQFVEQVLVERLRVRAVVVGENFRFGHRQAGDFATLKTLGERYGFTAVAVSPVIVGGQPVSSTRIRNLVCSGRVELVRRLTGRPFSLEGPVVKGHGVGSRHTVPTLNLSPEAEMLPAKGVYITETRDFATGRCWKSVSNVGYRPTFDGRDLSVEAHLLEELKDGPPERIRLVFYRRLRDEKRFAKPELLRRQILQDAEEATRFFRLLDAVTPKAAGIS